MSRWQDGGALDPPDDSARMERVQRRMLTVACPQCDAPPPLVETLVPHMVHGRTWYDDLTWVCVACEYVVTEDEACQWAEDDEADRDEAARDRYWQGRIDEARGK